MFSICLYYFAVIMLYTLSLPGIGPFPSFPTRTHTDTVTTSTMVIFNVLLHFLQEHRDNQKIDIEMF